MGGTATKADLVGRLEPPTTQPALFELDFAGRIRPSDEGAREEQGTPLTRDLIIDHFYDFVIWR